MKPALVLDLVAIVAALLLARFEGRRGNVQWQRLWLVFALGFVIAAAITLVRH